MKNFTDSDYALNKNRESIVYRFADGIVEVNLANYLAENPDKTIVDFQKLKEESDAIYFEQDRDEHLQTYKNTAFDEFEKDKALCVPSSEELFIDRIDAQKKSKIRQQKLKIAKSTLDKLTDTERRRYLLYVVKGLNERQIAELDKKSQQAISKSLLSAEKKINKNLLTT